MRSAVLKLLSVENLASERLLIWIVLPEMVLEGVPDYEGLSLAFLCEALKSRLPPTTQNNSSGGWYFAPGARGRIQKRGCVYLTKCSRMSFSF